MDRDTKRAASKNYIIPRIPEHENQSPGNEDARDPLNPGCRGTAGPQHAAKATSGSKTKPISVCFTRTSPQPAQIMNSSGKSRLAFYGCRSAS